jgi:undecaprenyl diphosphate synthase
MENQETKNLVNHVGVVIDGNRRYAKSRLLPAFKGHEAGADKVKKFLEWCSEEKIKEVTIYALSTENLKRTEEELSYLFKLFKKFFEDISKDKRIEKEKIKIKFIGDLSLVSKDIKELAEKLEERTKNNNSYIVNFCLAYGGRLELVHTINKLLKQKKENITEEDITNNLWLKSEPQFIIRTGGKTRTSNFLPWQSIYSEWFFIDKMWPEIEKSDLIECIQKFNSIQRNFGK